MISQNRFYKALYKNPFVHHCLYHKQVHMSIFCVVMCVYRQHKALQSCAVVVTISQPACVSANQTVCVSASKQASEIKRKTCSQNRISCSWRSREKRSSSDICTDKNEISYSVRGGTTKRWLHKVQRPGCESFRLLSLRHVHPLETSCAVDLNPPTVQKPKTHPLVLK